MKDHPSRRPVATIPGIALAVMVTQLAVIPPGSAKASLPLPADLK